MTDATERHLAYWQGFRAYCARTGTTLPGRKATRKYYHRLPLGYTGFAISLLAAQQCGILRCELYLDGEYAMSIFVSLHQHKAIIEAQLGTLKWATVPERKGQHIVLNGPPYDPYDEDTWELNYRWLKEQAERFQHTFTPYARALRPR